MQTSPVSVAWRSCLFGLALLAGPAVAALPTCDTPSFIAAPAESAWTVIDVVPGQGTLGIQQALITARDSYPDRPVRIRLAPGYYADNIGNEIYVQHVLRSASTPIHLVAGNPAANGTRLGQGINLMGVSYLAIEGITVGPEVVGPWNGSRHLEPLPVQAAAGIHVAGAARNGTANARRPDGTLDASIYGQFDPAHHILIKKVTIQNLFETTELDAETTEAAGMDGIKFNQAEDVWVLDSRIYQTTRHGIDNVGVHRGAYCRNLVARNGLGQGIEAKGGSTDILYDSNAFYRVRRVELGGENTDATYYFSADGQWNYEARGLVARNNLIVDPREAGLEFSGCAGCAAVGNTILFTSAYVPPMEGLDVAGGDAIRIHDSTVGGADTGAGSDCPTWNAAVQDYQQVEPCWGVGAHPPAPAGRRLSNSEIRVANNLFASAAGHFGRGNGGATVACPLNHIDGSPGLDFNGNYWWNGSSPLPETGCSALVEGVQSVMSTSTPTAPPQLADLTVDASSLTALAASIPLSLLPSPASPLLGHAVGASQSATYDARGQARPTPAAIGALETRQPASYSPAAGLWAIDAEVDGQPGRGFLIEPSGGVLVLTVYGYDSQGSARFYLASGTLAGNRFTGELQRYEGGTPLGGPTRPGSAAGSAGAASLVFTDETHGTIRFPGEPARDIGKFAWANPRIPGPGAPLSGLWAVTEEMNGQPGRGFALEDQQGVAVVALYGYEPAGPSTFHLGTGRLTGGQFTAELNHYEGGTAAGGAIQSAHLAGTAGTATFTFTDNAHGTVQFPGETVKAIKKFSW
jgi:hypothetical protein